ncbi:SAM-dependent chlorinase/fluorinase [Desulfobacula sp.]|uniref:SAM hydrolase/SAM-dependent halogenase family protein n=1 Tax=Desulfobacula sp. TaxID=2593537 RepID=UPI0026033FC7|nr:SAM-dependent chlorinase/fluorinase [Desulfobacula sp.]
MTHIQPRPIVLLTDFGQQDAFTGILKGVIAAISPESNVIDLTHGVDPQDILQGAFLLAAACPYFPRGSVFCAIVDPGVGSDRKGICIQTRDYYFVGPDNGLLWKAASENRIKRIIHLTNPAYFLDSVSHTFQGRDIFAPVAAHISKGLEDIARLGKPLKKCVEYSLPDIQRTVDSLGLTIVHIDRFGNVTLNIEGTEFKQFVHNKRFSLAIMGTRINRIVTFYSQALAGELFLIESSSGYMEVALKNANAADRLGVTCRDKCILTVF